MEGGLLMKQAVPLRAAAVAVLTLVLIISHAGLSTAQSCVDSDLNDDNYVNIKDIVLLAKHIGETPANSLWSDPNDINSDKIIDFLDLKLVNSRIGCSKKAVTCSGCVDCSDKISKALPGELVTLSNDIFDYDSGLDDHDSRRFHWIPCAVRDVGRIGMPLTVSPSSVLSECRSSSG